MAEWMPIETAPKDGTRIAVYEKGCGYIPFCYWDNEEPGWVSLIFRWGGNPTHWMPLPDPPKGGE